MSDELLRRTGGVRTINRDDWFEDFYSQNHDSLFRLAFVILGNASDAEEVVSDAFVKALSSWRLFSRAEFPLAYARKTVINLCKSRGRSSAREMRRLQALSAISKGRSSASDSEVLRLDVWEAVRQLPHRQRAAVVLRYLEDLSEVQVADVMGCSVGAVKSQLSKARQKLRLALASSIDREGQWI